MAHPINPDDWCETCGQHKDAAAVVAKLWARLKALLDAQSDAGVER